MKHIVVKEFALLIYIFFWIFQFFIQIYIIHGLNGLQMLHFRSFLIFVQFFSMFQGKKNRNIVNLVNLVTTKLIKNSSIFCDFSHFSSHFFWLIIFNNFLFVIWAGMARFLWYFLETKETFTHEILLFNRNILYKIKLHFSVLFYYFLWFFPKLTPLSLNLFFSGDTLYLVTLLQGYLLSKGYFRVFLRVFWVHKKNVFKQ